MRLLLFRHAETAWTLTGQHTGKTDLELTEAGEAEARATASLFQRLLSGTRLGALYSSPRRRALETAALALGSEHEPIVNEWLAEFDYGNYEGLTPAQIQALAPGWSLWSDGCPGGESVQQVSERADRFIQLLRERHVDDTVCAVSHGHLIRILSARLLGLEARSGGLFGIKTCSIADFAQKNGAFVLNQWNLTVQRG
ncbi:MAG TPA: histidine phosphatase family protein [Polyangiaceae bacterium]|jgi:probable phosphoglycerate mutase|nr:histidine phosphatase family protein [Polyangiaceae bacterium]